MASKRLHSPSNQQISTKKLKRTSSDAELQLPKIKIPLRKLKRTYSDSDLLTPEKEKIYSSNKCLKRLKSESDLQNINNEEYREISHHAGRYNRFSTGYFVTEFILRNAISFPENKLKEIFEKFIEEAYSKSNAFGKQVR